MTFNVRLSTLDSDRFGVVSARAEGVRAEDLPALLAFCDAHKVEFLIARCPAEDLQAVHALEEQSFLLMDTLVWYERGLTADDRQRDPNIRLADARDVALLRELAREAFAGYRGHYHADPRLPVAVCDALYVDWAVRSLQPPVADGMLIAEWHGELVGFAALKQIDSETVDLRLYGVSPGNQGKGWGGRLVRGACNWAVRRGAQRLVTSTQIVNWRSQRVWMRQGFRIWTAEYTFHKWFDEVEK